MRSLRISCLFLAAVFGSSAQDLKELEKKVTEFKLPNGMQFLLLERHEIPIVTFETYVGVGSVDDPAGQTGMAHIIERLASKGTDTIGTASWAAEKKALDAIEEAYDRVDAEVNKGVKADPIRVDMLRNQARLAVETAQRSQKADEFGRILEDNGATDRRALVAFDSSTYSCSLPSNRMELWFLMESQRLLHPVFRDFYKERDAALQDYRKQLENNPQAKLFGELLAAAFKAHPYRNPIEGWPGDTQSLRQGAAREFFERYYVPGNITMVIAGDVNPAEARRMAERYFGPMAARPMPPASHAEEPPQEGPKTVVVEAAGQPFLAIAYKRPSQYDKDDVTFDVIHMLLSQGTTGLLYRDLVQEKHLAAAARVAATFPSGRYPNLMVFFIVPAQGHSLDENQRALDDLLQRLKAQPVDAQSINRAKAQLQGILMQRLSTNQGMAGLLAEYHASYGGWRKLFTTMDDLNKVTGESVQKAAVKYLVATGRTTAFTVAPGQSDLPRPAAKPQPADPRTGGLQ